MAGPGSCGPGMSQHAQGLGLLGPHCLIDQRKCVCLATLLVSCANSPVSIKVEQSFNNKNGQLEKMCVSSNTTGELCK